MDGGTISQGHRDATRKECIFDPRTRRNPFRGSHHRASNDGPRSDAHIFEKHRPFDACLRLKNTPGTDQLGRLPVCSRFEANPPGALRPVRDRGKRFVFEGAQRSFQIAARSPYLKPGGTTRKGSGRARRDESGQEVLRKPSRAPAQVAEGRRLEQPDPGEAETGSPRPAEPP